MAKKKLAAKVKSGDGFDLNDFLAQISQMKKMGGLSGLMDKLPEAISFLDADVKKRRKQLLKTIDWSARDARPADIGDAAKHEAYVR